MITTFQPVDSLFSWVLFSSLLQKYGVNFYTKGMSIKTLRGSGLGGGGVASFIGATGCLTWVGAFFFLGLGFALLFLGFFSAI